MKNRYMRVEPEKFHSWLIPTATFFYGLAALLGLGGVICMLIPGSVGILVEDLVAGGITEASAIRAWKLIHVVLTVIAFAWPALFVTGYMLTIRKQPGKGLILLCNVLEGLLKLIKGIVIVLLVILVYRVIRYAVLVLPKDEGMYLLYAMFVSEALMLIVAGTLFVLLRRFLNSVCDSAASIADTLENARLSERSIPGFAATGFLIFGLVSLFFGLDRVFTMIIVQGYRSSHYAFLTAEHPLLLLSGGAMISSALGGFLSAIYLFGFKRKSEKMYHSFRRDLMK
jgi:hypothetical protein